MSPRPRHASRGTTRATPIGAKATTPTAESRQRGSRNGGAVSHERKHQPITPADQWAAAVDGVLERFRADMAERYAGEGEAHSVTVTKQPDQPQTPTQGGSSLPDGSQAQQSLSQDDGEERP